MRPTGGLLALALLAQPRPLYHWKDAQGQLHVTDTPPPPGAERMEAPPPPALEPARPDRLPQRADRAPVQSSLSPAQRAAWQVLDQRLARARAEKDVRTLETVVGALVDDSLWGSGRWALVLLPILSVALTGLLGWWLALGLRPGLRAPVIAGMLVVGFSFGQVLLTSLLYASQAIRLRENFELLETHLGGVPIRPAHDDLLQRRYRALEATANPLQPPWRFPMAVAALRRDATRVVLDP